MAQGYWQKPALTKEVFQAHIKHDSSHTNYLRTGDLGFIYEDELYITGRLKDIIIIRGCNVYPQDIEFTVACCHEAIRKGGVAVFASEDKGEEYVEAVVEIAKNTDPAMYLDIFRVIYQSVMREHIIALAHIVFVPPKVLPKTTSGKVRRQPCKQMLLQGQLPVIEEWKSEPKLQTQLELQAFVAIEHSDNAPLSIMQMTSTEVILRALWIEVLQNSTVQLTDNFFSLGGNSLLAVQLSQAITKMLKIECPTKAIFDYPLLQDMASYLEDCMKAQKGLILYDEYPITAHPEVQYEPFALSEVQQAYWVGRTKDFEGGGVGTHVYLELLFSSLDVSRLEKAWNRLIEHQPMLRVVFENNMQRCLAKVPLYCL